MAIINAEMNVKNSSNEYDQLYLKTTADLVGYSSTTQGKSSLTNTDLAIDSLLRGDYITLPNGSSIVTYATNTQESNTCQVVKIVNSTSVPTNYGYTTTSNEFVFISIKTNANQIQFVAIDNKSNNVFTMTKTSSSVISDWKKVSDGGNASQLDGIARTGFMQNYPNGTGLNLASTSYAQPYVANINEAQSTGIGLPNAWWHLMYLPHDGSSGYGCQVAFPLNSTAQKPKYRISLGTTWQDWKSMGGGGATISASAPTDTEALWIDSAGLMRYYNGSAWVAVKTNAVWS